MLILILGALSTISPFAIDMYLPGFPAIAEDLDTSVASVQLSLTSYFVGIAAGQLAYGPLLDRFGRKKPLYAGLAVYAVASLSCALTRSVEMLIAVRFLQALGGCAGMIAAQTLVRDLFPAHRTAHVFSWMILVIAVSPMVAPTVGGYLTASLGWQSVFVTLSIITLIILILVYYLLPAGNAPDKSVSLLPASVLRNFYAVIRNRQFLLYCVAGGLASAAPFAFIAGSADVYINRYGTSEQVYGWIFALVGGTIIACAQLNHVLLRKFSSHRIISISMIYQGIMGAILVAGVVTGIFGILTLTIMTVLFLSVHGLTNANATALALAPFTKNTGSAASLLGTFRMALAGVVTALVSVFHDGSAAPMVAMMAVCVFAGLMALATARVILHTRREAKANSTAH
ncbi:MAG TPA: multidrug effflux MFS transporter [Chryseosolibacter sp.]|nr:multidrug effflux MFS transporter [Chryseosolibacter sp.]